ncbi:MAG: hypothetical protein EON58_04855 [Alphaproteobacteria bacterium]|nr:MAG: hypothetical protein EON58_04855 [Alphaproteobacteria bacterium]
MGSSSDPYDRAGTIVDRLPTKRLTIGEYTHTMADASTPGKRQAWLGASERIEELSNTVAAENSTLIRMWSSDAALGAGELHRALAVYPRAATLARRSMAASKILSMKLAIGLTVDAADLLALYGPRVTKFGRENIEAIKTFLDVRLTALQAHERPNLLLEWANSSHELVQGYSLFHGRRGVACKPPRGLTFDLSAANQAEGVALIREAENACREELGLPWVGEGWVSETRLYYQLKGAFPGVQVQRHASPAWLGRQHLDVFFPELSVGVEYQGLQHDQPVAFFGGAEAFAKNQKRDRSKKMRCSRNGVRIVYVREGYVLSDVIAQIRSAQSARTR